MNTRIVNYFPVALLPLLAAALTFVVLAIELKAVAVVVFIAAALGGVTVMRAEAGRTFSFYLLYLLFEGALKIFSNYNPLMRVGSDLLLLIVFFRLYNRLIKNNTPDLKLADSARIHTVLPFLILFWLWIAVQFLNPWALGILPSFAGLKIYVIPMLVFFAVGFLLTDKELDEIPFLILCLGVIQAVVAGMDGFLGDGFLPRLHPRYIATMADRFIGILYRPFGTTALPGGPAVWMTHTVVAALLVINQLKTAQLDFLQKYKWMPYLVLTIYFPFAIATLMFCQGRTILLRFSLIAVFGALMLGSRRIIAGIAVLATLLGLAVPLLDQLARADKLPKETALRISQISSRFLSLGEQSTWESAREGALAGMLRLSEFTNLGIGLSRVGAASEPWSELIDLDPNFGDEWTFADNLYRCLYTEVGIFGLIAYLLLIAVIVVQCLSIGSFEGKIVAFNCAIFLLAGFGSEGVLYQPDACFFWLYSSWALRRTKRSPSNA